MTINKIKVTNIKGISSKIISENIIANKPTLLVAPNGYGKSSIATAFASLNQSRLKLEDEDRHNDDPLNHPSLELEITEQPGSIITIKADDTRNEINARFDIFVINSRIQAKAIKRNFGKFTTASALMSIKQVILVDKISKNANFAYRITEQRDRFGANGRCLQNIDFIFQKKPIVIELLSAIDSLNKFTGTRIQRDINLILHSINSHQCSNDALIPWIEANFKNRLESIKPIADISAIIKQYAPEIGGEIKLTLAALQVCMLFQKDKNQFKSACEYASYLYDKEMYTNLISSFDTTWKQIKPKETKGQLIVEFPAAHSISNGQRDSLVFASMMQRMRNRVRDKNIILVIDEVFDYMDDANLTAAQYYISGIIDDVKSRGRRIYPLILTHLNPLYFRNYAFQDQKVHFIDKRLPQIGAHFLSLIRNREHASIKAHVDRHHLHYFPGNIDIQNEFEALGLKKTWGKSEIFRQHLDSEWGKYSANGQDYDPFAVCCYIRVKIEESIYGKLRDDSERTAFIAKNGTNKKLDYAISIGITVPEVCFLLGIIYNEGLHIRQNVDNSSPIVAKLENLVIRKMANVATSG